MQSIQHNHINESRFEALPSGKTQLHRQIHNKQKTVTLNRFGKIRQLLIFNDNDTHLTRESDNHFTFHKHRPVVDHLNGVFSKIPLEIVFF